MTPAPAASLETPVRWRLPRTSWRAALRQDMPVALTVAIGFALNFGFGAWSTLGVFSADLLAFLSLELCQTFVLTLAQLTLLRWLPAAQPPNLAWLGLRIALVTSICWPAFNGTTPASDLVVRLGLAPSETLSHYNLFIVWTMLWISAVLVWRDEGRRREASAAERLRQLQAAQLEARRRLVETQLQAMQARVDPQLFFDTLDAAQRLYQHDPPQAEALLEALITFLRAALPRLQSPSSSLAQELALAESYVRVRALAGADVLMLVVEVPAELLKASFPSGVLLPMLTGALAASPARARLELKATREPLPQASARLTVSLASRLDLPPTLTAGIAATLHALYGSAAAVSSRHVGPGYVETRVSVPHQPASSTEGSS